jgi:excisionase family DNA binding protein
VADLILPREAADILRVRPKRVYELVAKGTLPEGVAVKIGRQLRINRTKLDEWIEAGGTALEGGWRREARNR